MRFGHQFLRPLRRFQLYFICLRLNLFSQSGKGGQACANGVIATIGAVAVAGAVTGGAIAFASNDSEGGVSGPQADRVLQVALQATGGGTASAVERDGENGGVWEVEVRKPDGAIVDVRPDENYSVLMVEGDNETGDTDDAGA